LLSARERGRGEETRISLVKTAKVRGGRFGLRNSRISNSESPISYLGDLGDLGESNFFFEPDDGRVSPHTPL
jgi:hypothetical protein